MNYNSPRSLFRDMHKNPDKYPYDYEEKQVIKEELVKDAKENNDEITQTNKEKENKTEQKEKIITSEGRAFKSTVDNISSASLLVGVNNPSEENILEQRKKLTMTYLSKVLEDVQNYLTQVNVLQMHKLDSYDDISKYQSIVQSSDTLRRSYHNKLISDLKIAVRLINVNFNADYTETLRLQEEHKVVDRRHLSIEELKKLMQQRKYFNFALPGGAFINMQQCPKDPQGEREYIAYWALKLYHDLTALNEEMRQILEKK